MTVSIPGYWYRVVKERTIVGKKSDGMIGWGRQSKQEAGNDGFNVGECSWGSTKYQLRKHMNYVRFRGKEGPRVSSGLVARIRQKQL